MKKNKYKMNPRIFVILFVAMAASVSAQASGKISLNYKEENKFFTVPLKVGTPSQIFEVQVDTTTSETWVPSNNTNYTVSPKYVSSASKTSVETNKTFEVDDEDGDVRGKAVYDSINLGNYHVDSFGFVQVETYPKDFTDYPYGKLGLGFKQEHGDSFNILAMLKEKKLIKNEIYVIEPKNKEIYFGEIPSLLNTSKLSLCNITETDDLDDDYRAGWVCELTHMFFGESGQSNIIDNAEEVESRIIFDSAYQYISIPIKFIKLFENKFINPIFNDTCTKVREGEATYFICEYDKGRFDKAVLSFVIQGYGYVLTAEDLFVKKAETKYEMILRFYQENDDIWSFGVPFVSKQPIMFDMENKQVGIFDGKKVDLNEEWEKWLKGETPKQKKERMKLLIIMTSVVGGVLLLVVVCLIVKTCRKNRGNVAEHGPLVQNEV